MAMTLLLPKTGYVLVDAKSAADATGVGVMPIDVCGLHFYSTYYVTFDGTAAAGTVLIESAPSPTYAGTWVTEGTVNFSAASKAHRVSLAILTGAVRARITSAVTSGTVTVTAFCATAG